MLVDSVRVGWVH